MKRKISEVENNLEQSLKKLKLNDNDTLVSHASTQTEVILYTETEVQEIIRRLRSEHVSSDNFGQTLCLHQTKV